ncbi:MAG: Ig-like domain-containing protein, partial [Oscillospiraceae bacterium]|nr:Ig-like domain-containing protein [Oscillospiraceae bacterium]
MKNKLRFLSLLLALTMVFSLWGPAYAAEGEGLKLSMTVSQSSIKVGEAVTVTIETDKAFSTRGSGMTIYYDAEKLEPDLDSSSAAASLQIHAVSVNGKTALRVSFLPGLEPATFSASEALAQIRFNALAVTEETSISMGAAYLYDDLLTEIALEKPAAVNLTIDPAEVNIPVTGISLDKTELTIEEGEMEALKATIEPIGASDPTVIWASSDETVAVVSGGVVKALAEGTATITATTQDGGFSASCTVTVTAPYAGYTVKMPADTTTAIGGLVRIPVVISNEDGKTGYNAFAISFTYDPEILELLSTKIRGVTVTAKDGKLNV